MLSASAAHRAERKWSCPNNQFEGGKYHRRHETIDISSDFILFYFLNKKRKSINQKNDLEMTKQRNRREKTTAAATKKKQSISEYLSGKEIARKESGHVCPSSFFRGGGETLSVPWR